MEKKNQLKSVDLSLCQNTPETGLLLFHVQVSNIHNWLLKRQCVQKSVGFLNCASVEYFSCSLL